MSNFYQEKALPSNKNRNVIRLRPAELVITPINHV